MKRIAIVFLSYTYFASAMSNKDFNDTMFAAIHARDVNKFSMCCDQDPSSIHFKNENGLNALMIAAYYGVEDIAQLLIDKGVNVDEQNIYGNNALINSCSKDHSEIVSLLIAHKANVNAQNKGGWTPLMHAIAFGKKDNIVVMLCENGADIDVQDDEGNKAIDVAQQYRREAIVAYLQSLHAKNNF